MAGTSVTFDVIARDMASSKLNRIGGSADRASGGIRKLGGQIGNMAKTWGPVAAAAAGAFAVKFGVDAVNAASDAQQSIGATETVFGKFADTVIDRSKESADKFGLSANDYRQNMNLLGSLFKNQGVATDQLADKTDEMIGLGTDLAATFGGTTSDAVEALGSAFKGEFDPLEKYGVSLKQSGINAEAAKLAMQKYGKNLDDLSPKQQAAMKQQATVKELLKQSADSAGAFASESDTLAHKQQVLKAKFNDLKVEIGDKLLPIATSFTDWLSEDGIPLGKQFADRLSEFKPLIDGFNDALRDAQPLLDLFSGSADESSDSAKALGLAFDALKGPIALTTGTLRAMGKVLGALGEVAKAAWNNGLQPVFHFMAEAISTVLRKLGEMFTALGSIKGAPKWIGETGEKLLNAADKAQRLADNIQKIPNQKNVNIDVWVREHRFQTGNEETTIQGFKGNRSSGAGAAPRSSTSGTSRSFGRSSRTSAAVAGSSADAVLTAMANGGLVITLMDGDAGRKALMSVPGALAWPT